MCFFICFQQSNAVNLFQMASWTRIVPELMGVRVTIRVIIFIQKIQSIQKQRVWEINGVLILLVFAFVRYTLTIQFIYDRMKEYSVIILAKNVVYFFSKIILSTDVCVKCLCFFKECMPMV